MIRILLLTLAVSSARSDMSPFIVGGREVSISRWPFIAFIEAAFKNKAASACGGSLISSQTVLTAAHCVDDVTDSKKLMSSYRFTIYMGHSSLSSSTMTRNAIDYTSHRNYDPHNDAVVADIAILFLGTPVKFASNIKKVLLVKRPFNVHVDRKLEVAGWGSTKSGRSYLSTNLKSVDVSALSFNKCKEKEDTLENSVICTSASMQHAYSGDSGGPLIKRNSQYQIGLVSYRDEDTGVTIFSSVPSYYAWIKNTQYALFKKYCYKTWN